MKRRVLYVGGSRAGVFQMMDMRMSTVTVFDPPQAPISPNVAAPVKTDTRVEVYYITPHSQIASVDSPHEPLYLAVLDPNRLHLALADMVTEYSRLAIQHRKENEE